MTKTTDYGDYYVNEWVDADGNKKTKTHMKPVDQIEEYEGELAINQDFKVCKILGKSHTCPDCNFHWILENRYGEIDRPPDYCWVIPLSDIMPKEEYDRFKKYYNSQSIATKRWREMNLSGYSEDTK